MPVSALNGDNIDELLDMILLQSDVMELKANPKANLEAIVVEARVKSVVVLLPPNCAKGNLKIGDSFVYGKVYCKVKEALIDDKGNQLKSTSPSTPVNVLGWSGVPDSGSVYRGCKNERDARRNAEEAEDLEEEQIVPEEEQVERQETEDDSASAAVDALFAAISKGKSTIYRLILEADVRVLLKH